MKNPKYLRKNVFIVDSPKLKLNQLLPAKSTQNWSCFYQKEQNLIHLSSKGTKLVNLALKSNTCG